MIAIVDYGVGNLFSLKSSLSYLGLENEVCGTEEGLLRADRIILPGVGAFEDAIAKLRATGLVGVLNELVQEGRPFLGICLGMQMLFERSLEYGVHEGLGYLSGEVAPLAASEECKVPQMQWNALHIVRECPLLKYTNEGDFVYFVHSYAARDCDSSLVATCDYGGAVTAAVAKGKLFGTQFHPEKSGAVGLKILRAFSEV